jgi:hypothetical protein
MLVQLTIPGNHESIAFAIEWLRLVPRVLKEPKFWVLP